jgi:hypothetical protein
MAKTLFDYVDEMGQAGVAEALGSTVSTINRISNGRTGVSDDIHQRATRCWREAYDPLGTVAESMRRKGLLGVSAEAASDAP